MPLGIRKFHVVNIIVDFLAVFPKDAYCMVDPFLRQSPVWIHDKCVYEEYMKDQGEVDNVCPEITGSQRAVLGYGEL